MITLRIAAEDDVIVPVSVDIIGGAAGFDRQEFLLDHVSRPTIPASAVPNQSRSDLAETEDKIDAGLRVDFHRQRACLLRRIARLRKFASLTRQCYPGHCN